VIEGEVNFYEQTDYRDNWDRPSPENVAKSLRDAHAFGRLIQASNHRLVEEVNTQSKHVKGLQADTGRLSQQVFNLKLRNAVIVAVVTGLVTRAPEIVRWVLLILR
jgi:hypothetical protein